MKKLSLIFLFLFALQLAAQQSADEIRYDNLKVDVSKIKNTSLSITQDNPGVYTSEYTANDNSWKMLVTLSPADSPDFSYDPQKKELEEKGKTLLPNAEEKSIVLTDLKKDSSAVGCYYSLTDKAPAEGEYKYLVQGFIRYNYLIGFFTFFCSEKENIKYFNAFDVINYVKDTSMLTKTEKFEKYKLSESELSGYRLQYRPYFYSMQQFIFSNNFDTYKMIMSDLEEKYSQSICTDREKGTVFFYCFREKIDSDRAAFLKGLFYGESGMPSKDHPETIFIKDNYLVVFSYPYKSLLQQELMDRVTKKFN